MLTKDNILKALRTNKKKLRKFGIRNVGLFGSHINNEQSSESDIDLLILSLKRKTLPTLWQFMIYLSTFLKMKKLSLLPKMA